MKTPEPDDLKEMPPDVMRKFLISLVMEELHALTVLTSSMWEPESVTLSIKQDHLTRIVLSPKCPTPWIDIFKSVTQKAHALGYHPPYFTEMEGDEITLRIRSEQAVEIINGVVAEVARAVREGDLKEPHWKPMGLTRALAEHFQCEIVDGVTKIHTPFLFPDGDCITVGLKFTDKSWRLTDGGDTYLHLAHHFGERWGESTLGDVMAKVGDFLEMHQVKEQKGEIFKVCEERHEIPVCFFDFLHCLLKVADIVFEKQG